MSFLSIMIDGAWQTDVPTTPDLDARLSRVRSFTDRISPEPEARFPVEPGRYHLYVSYACPWAHRVILMRSLLGLERAVGMSVVHPDWQGRGGWTFEAGALSDADPNFGARHLAEIYARSAPRYTGKVTVPCLVDRVSGRIVNNQSCDIMEMLGQALLPLARHPVDLYPADLRGQQEAVSRWIVRHLSSAVYRVGFARSFAEFLSNLIALFAALEETERRLGAGPYLFGERLTAADLHLFTMLFRFEVYAYALRCDLRPITDFPNLVSYRQRIAALPEVIPTLRPDHVAIHYPRHLSEIPSEIDAWLERARAGTSS